MKNTKKTTAAIEFEAFILEIVGALVDLIEEIDPFLRKHSERVANNSANFCAEFKLMDEKEIDTVYYAGLLHDIGLATVPIDLSRKSDELTGDEEILLKRHPVSGAKILSNLSFLNHVMPLIRHHHEAFNGSGYPDGLRGDEIPLGARILGLFNQFDKIAFPRSTGKRMPVEDALKEIKKISNQMFDENLIPNFITFIRSNSRSEERRVGKEC